MSDYYIRTQYPPYQYLYHYDNDQALWENEPARALILRNFNEACSVRRIINHAHVVHTAVDGAPARISAYLDIITETMLQGEIAMAAKKRPLKKKVAKKIVKDPPVFDWAIVCRSNLEFEDFLRDRTEEQVRQHIEDVELDDGIYIVAKLEYYEFTVTREVTMTKR